MTAGGIGHAIEVAGVWEFHWLVVRDPEPEQCNEDLTIEGACEGKQHKCPCIGEWIVAFMSHSDEHCLLIHVLWVLYSVMVSGCRDVHNAGVFQNQKSLIQTNLGDWRTSTIRTLTKDNTGQRNSRN